MGLNNSNENNQSYHELVVTKSEFTPLSMMAIDINLTEENIDKLLRAAGYELPESFVKELHHCLCYKIDPLNFPSKEKPYEDLMAYEEKHYKILPQGQKNRVSLKEEITLENGDSDIPTIILHSDIDARKFNLEVFFSGSNNSWDSLDQIGEACSGIIPSQDELVVQDLNNNGEKYTFRGYDISIVFSKKSSLRFPAASQKIETQQELVPYLIQLTTSPEDVDATVAKQFNSEMMNSFLSSGALKAIKRISGDPIKISDLPLDLNNAEMIKNQTHEINFSYRGEIFASSEDSYFDNNGFNPFLETIKGDAFLSDLASFFEQNDKFEDEIPTGSFIAEFNDTEVGTVTMNIGNISYFDTLDKRTAIDYINSTQSMPGVLVEFLWDVSDFEPNREALKKYDSIVTKCVESIGVKNYESFLRRDLEGLPHCPNSHETHFKKNGFEIKVKYKKVMCPVETSNNEHEQ